MPRNLLAWKEKKKKAGWPQRLLAAFYFAHLWVATFLLILQEFMWEREEATAAAKHSNAQQKLETITCILGHGDQQLCRELGIIARAR